MGPDVNKTDAMIDRLTDGLRPLQSIKIHTFSAVLFALTFVYAAVIMFLAGLRPDLATKITELTYLIEVISATLIYITSAIASVTLRAPDSFGKPWLVYIPFVPVVIFLIATIIRVATEGMHMPHIHWDPCFTEGIALGALPAFFLMFVTMSGSVTRPFMLAGMITLAAMSLSYVGLRFTCMMDTVGHSFVIHVMPTVLFGAYIGIFARRLFYW